MKLLLLRNIIIPYITLFTRFCMPSGCATRSGAACTFEGAAFHELSNDNGRDRLSAVQYGTSQIRDKMNGLIPIFHYATQPSASISG